MDMKLLEGENIDYNTFQVIEADPNEFKEKNKVCDTVVLNIGESFEF